MNKFVVVIKNEYGNTVYAYEETETENLPTQNTNNLVLVCKSYEELKNCLEYYNSDNGMPYPNFGNGKLIDLYEPLVNQLD